MSEALAYQRTYSPLDTPKSLGWDCCFLGGAMPPEPAIKRAVALVDDRNIFHAVCDVFSQTARRAGAQAQAMKPPRASRGTPVSRTTPDPCCVHH
jgi:hypothetical protein